VFIDTPAAYPGVESEERGVAEAIAFNLREMMMLEVPIIVIVCGEGGSGGALGLAIGDRVLMQEFSVYSVIPPEGCAAILWRDANRKVDAAEALKITAPDLSSSGSSTRSSRAGRRRPQRSGRASALVDSRSNRPGLLSPSSTPVAAAATRKFRPHGREDRRSSIRGATAATGRTRA
jgi:acetyl-CoA carboxylase carboxyltransferase component